MKNEHQIFVCFSGAPCSGKTASMKLLGHMHGYKELYIVDEAPTYIVNDGHGLHQYPTTGAEMDAFDKMIYHSRVLSTLQARKRSENIIFFDRGTLDSAAYCEDFCKNVGTTIEQEYSRYDAIILLETLAAVGKYSNNKTRGETPEQAQRLHKRLVEIYGNHPNFLEVPANMDSIRRVSMILEFIDSLSKKS
jgi:predicted ATPase